MRRRISRIFDDCPAHRLFALVAEVEAYPDFAPFCRSVRILARRDGFLRVAQDFGAGPLRLRFVSEAVFTPPQASAGFGDFAPPQASAAGLADFTLKLSSTDPTFRHFRIDWRIVDRPDGCRATCDIDLSFRNPALELLAHLSGDAAIAAAVAAFRRRAAQAKGRTPD